MPTSAMGDEPSDTLARVEYYRALLDEAAPEYWPLTRQAQQMWNFKEIEQQLGMVSVDRLRRDLLRGRLPGAVPGSGRASTEVPRSTLIVYLGRLVTGWYDRRTPDEADAVG